MELTDKQRAIQIELGVKLLGWKRGKYRPDGQGVTNVGAKFKRHKVDGRWIYNEIKSSEKYPFMSPDGEMVFGYDIPSGVMPPSAGRWYDPFHDIEDAWLLAEAVRSKKKLLFQLVEAKVDYLGGRGFIASFASVDHKITYGFPPFCKSAAEAITMAAWAVVTKRKMR